MTRKIPLYIGTTALLLVLGTPAFAQSVVITQQDVGSTTIAGLDPTQTNINSAVIFAPGMMVSSFAGQDASTLFNAIGPTSYVGVGSPYTITQLAGTYFLGTPPTGTLYSDTVNSTSLNFIGADNSGFPELATVVAGGNQSASNQVNLANIEPAAGSIGSLTQGVGAATLTAVNRMFAVATNGSADVIGSDGTTTGAGFQTAIGTLNTAGVFLTPPTPGPGDATDLTLVQKLTDNNTITAINSAIANSTASESATLEPGVQNISQSSEVGVNQLSFASGTAGSPPAAIAASATLDGSQNGLTLIPTVVAGVLTLTPGTLTATIGNTVAAYTGPNSDGLGSNPYNLVTPAGNGIASVSGVTQNANFGLNNVFGGSGVSLALTDTLLPLSGFLQTVDGSYEQVTGPTGAFGNVYPNVINGIATSSGAGSASITGVALSSTNATPTQSFINQQNSISIGGTLSGTAAQTAIDFAPLSGGGVPVLGGLTFPSGYYNVALAEVGTGPSSITNVSQNMSQSLNSVTGGSGDSLILAQTAGGAGLSAISLGSNNVEGAVGTSNAAVTGAAQFLNTSVNTASLPGGLSGTLLTPSALTQTGTGITLVNSNLLAAASTANAAISGSQSANLALNVATLGSVSGLVAVSQTVIGATLTNTNTMLASSSFDASISGAQVATSAINVIK